jgi:hypothetical protein
VAITVEWSVLFGCAKVRFSLFLGVFTVNLGAAHSLGPHRALLTLVEHLGGFYGFSWDNISMFLIQKP